MRVYSFFALIHLDRFTDLALVVGNNDVAIDPHSVGCDNTVEVQFTGRADTAMKLESCLKRISYILEVPPSLEWSE